MGVGGGDEGKSGGRGPNRRLRLGGGWWVVGGGWWVIGYGKPDEGIENYNKCVLTQTHWTTFAISVDRIFALRRWTLNIPALHCAVLGKTIQW